ncbi:hypothetical protein DPEC_G00229370 [Dallia pectoralis]|uniref:Uncharacterized protein n=1 Tax=Dallia pectoralis TaxID=75939 RepID=A0ACC2G1Q1_DALPE|nr:hypothetical protein DPEC_G00229370 [Dallia pectoralis]
MSLAQGYIPLLLFVVTSRASHFYGGTMTFNSRGTNPDEAYRMEHRYKTGFHSCSDSDTNTWMCDSGDCGNQTSLVVQTVDQEISGDFMWCQREGVSTISISNNTHSYDLRSDTAEANQSPQTTVIPLLRVPLNCQRDFPLLTFDPDEDIVRCRYADADASPATECVKSSNMPLDFTIHPMSCTFSFSSLSNSTGTFAVQMVMEDFPTQSISLVYNDGTQSNRTSVDPAVPSCTEGEYLPLFLPPTPDQGAVLNASIDQPLEITVSAQANQSTLTELLVSGPQLITKNTTSPGLYLLIWTPTTQEEGGAYPVCFIVQGVIDSYNGGNWIFNDNSVVSWKLLTHVDLGVRSDTGEANQSPQTTVIPLMRVPVNCPRDFQLLTFDPDMDIVRCRYAEPPTESVTSSNITSSNMSLDFTIQPMSCTFSFSSLSNSTGTFAVQMVMEDFPTQSISLVYNDGTQSNRTSGEALSKLPVQFAIRVDPAVPSCTEGEYLPLFLPPTPDQGAVLNASIDQPLEITVSAQANQSTVTELLVSGPQLITKNTTSPGLYLLRWTPTNDQAGGAYPVCFIAQGVFNFDNVSSQYQSELRCVTIKVGNQSAPTTGIPATTTTTSNPTTTRISRSRHILVLNIKLSYQTSLSNENITSVIFPEIYNQLINYGLLTHVNLGVRSDTGKANQSPQTTVVPLMRVPVNCPRDFHLLTFDPDMDMVRCRYAEPPTESVTSSNITSSNMSLDFTIQPMSCTFSFSSLSNSTGTFAVQMVMEDFPTQSISLVYNDGTQSNRTSGEALSKLPVHFAIRVDPAVPSCTEGKYLPLFLPPTPDQGAVLNASIDQPLMIIVSVQAKQSTVTELLVSGPQLITKNTITPGLYLLIWTPTNDKAGGAYPVCFIAQGVFNLDNTSSLYQSELRCVTIRVGNQRAPTKTFLDNTLSVKLPQISSPLAVVSTNLVNLITTSSSRSRHILVVNIKLSSQTPFSDVNITSEIFLQIYNQLINYGVNRGLFTIRLIGIHAVSP